MQEPDADDGAHHLTDDDDGAFSDGASEADVEEQRGRRGGAAPAERVDESQSRNIIDKLKANKANCTYAGLMKMLRTLLKLQVEGCTVDGQSAFKTWLKLAKDSHRSLAEGTDAAAVLLGLLEDVDGTLERVQDKTPLNPKMRKEQEAVRKIVPQARRALSCTACPPTPPVPVLLSSPRCMPRADAEVA